MPTPVLRLLIVDDDDVLRDTLPILLEADDREIVVCETAEEALVRHRVQPFDVVLTDVSLDGASGLDLARAVLADDPAAWVLVVSGYTLDPGVRALGANVHVLQKPFTAAQVEALIALRRP